METATFTPAISIDSVGDHIAGISFDWSESLVYVGENGVEVNYSGFSEYSENGIGCKLLDNEAIRDEIENAVVAILMRHI